MTAKNIVCVVSQDTGLSTSLKAPFKASGLTLTTHVTVSDFIESLDPAKPVGCVIADLHIGTELLKELAEVHAVVPVVLLAAAHNVTTAVQAIKAGAYDVVERTEALAESARKACAFFTKCQKLVEEKAVAAERIDSLTRRETQVLHLMVEGKPNRDIAEELGISTKTLDIHRANLMDKMEARTPADMCRAYLLHKTHPMHLAIVGGRSVRRLRLRAHEMPREREAASGYRFPASRSSNWRLRCTPPKKKCVCSMSIT